MNREGVNIIMYSYLPYPNYPNLIMPTQTLSYHPEPYPSTLNLIPLTCPNLILLTQTLS